MDHRAAVFRRAVPIGLVVLVSAFSGGCAAPADPVTRPTASVQSTRLDGITLQALTIRFEVEVDNPYSVPLPLTNIDYTLATDARPWLKGRADLRGAVPAQGSKIVSLPVRVVYRKAMDAMGTFRPGQDVPYQAELGLSVDPPVVGPIRLLLKKAGRLPIPAPCGIEVRQIRRDERSLDPAGGWMVLRVTNRNEFALDLVRMSYGLSLGGAEVARSSLACSARFPAGGAGEVEIPVSLSPESPGPDVWRLIRGGRAEYELAGTMDASTEFGTVSIPFRSAPARRSSAGRAGNGRVGR